MLGLLGGLSWRSTAEYYRLLNEGARARLGGQHSAKLVLWSFDFQEMTELKEQDNWKELAKKAEDAAERLEASGAEALVICSNTMHRVAPEVRAAVDIPLIHILDATANEIALRGSCRPILLGTRYTVEGGFAARKLYEHSQINVLSPDKESCERVHEIIYAELCEVLIKLEAKLELLSACERLRKDGADGVILGCTELAMILSEDDFDIPVFDTTRIHANSALDFALQD